MYIYKEISKEIDSKDLVLGNLRLVVHLAKQFVGMGLELDDLIHEGVIGLCKAAEKYDEDKGKFSSYAALWIKAIIRQALSNKSRTIRIPSNKNHLDFEGLPTVSSLDETYQGSYEPEVNIKADFNYNVRKIRILLGKLTEKQALIISMKYGLNDWEETKTSDIAKKLEMTPQAINGNIRNALKIMKSELTNER